MVHLFNEMVWQDPENAFPAARARSGPIGAPLRPPSGKWFMVSGRIVHFFPEMVHSFPENGSFLPGKMIHYFPENCSFLPGNGSFIVRGMVHGFGEMVHFFPENGSFLPGNGSFLPGKWFMSSRKNGMTIYR